MLKDYAFRIEGTVFISAESKESAEFILEDWIFYSPVFLDIDYEFEG